MNNEDIVAVQGLVRRVRAVVDRADNTAYSLVTILSQVMSTAQNFLDELELSLAEAEGPVEEKDYQFKVDRTNQG